MSMIDPPSRISGKGSLDGEDCASQFDAEDEVERLFRSAQAARSRPAPDQPRRGGLSGSGCSGDRSGPPAAVGVLEGGSLAGKDSSSSSSSLSSGFDCVLLGGDFRGSIPASPWRCSAL
jgi:hypothetical protein